MRPAHSTPIQERGLHLSSGLWPFAHAQCSRDKLLCRRCADTGAHLRAGPAVGAAAIRAAAVAGGVAASWQPRGSFQRPLQVATGNVHGNVLYLHNMHPLLPTANKWCWHLKARKVGKDGDEQTLLLTHWASIFLMLQQTPSELLSLLWCVHRWIQKLN